MNLAITFRKIHRFFVLIIIALTAVMAFTGIAMKYSLLTTDLAMLRYVHNNLSVLFTAVLVIMAVTGTYLYFFPWLMKRKQKKMQSGTAKTQLAGVNAAEVDAVKTQIRSAEEPAAPAQTPLPAATASDVPQPAQQTKQ
jgi:uncharacterized iron-regulated membrane protein